MKQKVVYIRIIHISGIEMILRDVDVIVLKREKQSTGNAGKEGEDEGQRGRVTGPVAVDKGCLFHMYANTQDWEEAGIRAGQSGNPETL